MVRNGHAVAYREFSTAYVPAEEEASRKRVGLWAGTFERPQDWRRNEREAATAPAPPRKPGCDIKGNISSKGEKIYHLPKGRYYDATRIDTAAGERWFCTEDEALRAGWRPSAQ
mmetsp:Transcript_27513/g.65173  ORF Transcript_27513/g.65173 Transcript_27513/m.65173 type:complete len:114 (+) Transcript_27513:1159-1500(+)